MNDNILFKSNNNYRTLTERNKENCRYISIVRNNSANHFHDISNSINQSKKYNSLNMKMLMNKGLQNNRNIIGNMIQKQLEKQNLNNNFIDNSILRFNKNMNVSAIIKNKEKTKFKSNNEIKTFQINNLKYYNRNNNIYSNSTLNSYFRLTEKNSDSRIKLKEKNNVYNNYNKFTSNGSLENQKVNRLYNKYQININHIINNLNDLLLTDNRISNIRNTDSHSLLNSKIFHKYNKICLTQRNKDIKSLNICDNKIRAIKNNIAH